MHILPLFQRTESVQKVYYCEFVFIVRNAIELICNLFIEDNLSKLPRRILSLAFLYPEIFNIFCELCPKSLQVLATGFILLLVHRKSEVNYANQNFMNDINW